MPRKRRGGRKGRRRVKRGGKKQFYPGMKKRNYITSIFQNGTLLPPRLKTYSNFRISGYIDGNVLADQTVQTMTFKGNSIVQPFNYTSATDILGIGFATGYAVTDYPLNVPDLLGAGQVYRSFRVYGSKITIEMASTQTLIGVVSILSKNVVTASNPDPLTVKDFENFPFVKSKNGIFSDQPFKLSSYQTTKQVYGVNSTSIQSNDDLYAGTYLLDPVGMWKWMINFNLRGATIDDLVNFTVKIKYYYEFFNHRQIE